MSESEDSERQLVFVWEVEALDRRGRVIATGAGATALEAKLDLVRDLNHATEARIRAVRCERVLVDWKAAAVRRENTPMVDPPRGSCDAS